VGVGHSFRYNPIPDVGAYLMLSFAAFAVFAALWLGGLVTGSVLFGGSPIRLRFIRRRENPVGYIAVMFLLGVVALFALASGIEALN